MSKPGYTDTMRGNVVSAFARRADFSASPPVVSGLPKAHEGRSKLAGACAIEIDRVVADPDQPRTEFSDAEIDDLAASLKARGQLQPIRTRWDPSLGKYVVILGERRLRAAMKAGMSTIACVVVEDNATPDDRLEDQLVENALRVNLSAIEQAKSYQRLIDSRGYSHRELAERLNIPHPAVTQAMQLLTLPEAVQAAVDAGEIRASTAYEIAKVEDPAEQTELAIEAAAGRLSRDEVRERVARSSASKGRAGGKAKGKPKAPKLPTERKHKAGNGLRVLVTGRKGFDVLEWLEALRDAVRAAEAVAEGVGVTDGPGPADAFGATPGGPSGED